MTTTNQQPRLVYKRAYPNLDSIFGHVYSNVPGEPIYPSKIATFYLLRVLFQTHFGTYHYRSETPLTTQEKNRIFQHLYSLMELPIELSYELYRKVLRLIFAKQKNIELNFLACMEEIAQGTVDLTLSIEDEFYTNIHSKLAYGPVPEGQTEQFFFEEQLSKELHFSSSHSHMYRWLKRVLAHASKMSLPEKFEMTTKMRDWLLSSNPECWGRDIAFHLESSLKTRHYIAQTLVVLQKCPTRHHPYKHILGEMKLVQSLHKDISEAHLVEAICHVLGQDPFSAVKAMKKFFDYSMFILTENIPHAMRTFRLTIPTSSSLLYGPILQARIHRMFGDYPTARQLLQESLQQAQLRGDEITHQLANIELHTIDVIGMGPILEQKEDANADSPNNMDNDRRVQRKALKNIDDLNAVIGPMAPPCCSYTEDDYELCTEMDSLSKMLMMLRNMSKSAYVLQYNDPSEVGLRLPVGHDLDDRAKKIEGYGYAIMTSNLIRNGMFQQAMLAGAEQVLFNPGEETGTKLVGTRFSTETWAVIICNMAYAQAGLGNHDIARKLINKGYDEFPEYRMWQCHRHFDVARGCVQFERYFLEKRYKKGRAVIEFIRPFSTLEFTLRLALLLACEARGREAIELLHGLKIYDNKGRIRVHMQLASIYLSLKMYEKADLELKEADKLCELVTLRDVKPLIMRRKATLLMCQGKYAEAKKILKGCMDRVKSCGSFVEIACCLLTKSRVLRLSKEDPRIWLKLARQHVTGKKWPTFTKAVICEIAALHEPDGMFPNADRLHQMRMQFGEWDTDYPGTCDWMLV